MRRSAMPKIAALLAAAQLPEPEPVPTVTLQERGPPAGRSARWTRPSAPPRCSPTCSTSPCCSHGAAARGAQERRCPVHRRHARQRSRGWLGAFEVSWTQRQPDRPRPLHALQCLRRGLPRAARSTSTTRSTSRLHGHRDCVKACGAAGAIDFERAPRGARPSSFDLVLDLRAAPAFALHEPPQGYFHLPRGEARPQACDAVLKLRELVGEFEKPKFFDYKQKLCAHSRNEQIGCNACIDVCSAEAITQRARRASSIVRRAAPVRRLRRLHDRLPDRRADATPIRARPTRARRITHAAGHLSRGPAAATPALLLHSQERGAGAGRASSAARRAARRALHGVPARVLPLDALAHRVRRHRPLAGGDRATARRRCWCC